MLGVCTRPTFATTALLLLLGAPAGAQEIPWRYDYNAALRESSEKKLPLFLDVGKEACINCVKLDMSTFRDPAIGKMLTERFIPVKVDGEKNSVQVQGQIIQRFPTLVFIGPDSNVLAVQEGFIEAAPLHAQAQKILAGLNPAPRAQAKPATPPQAQALAPSPSQNLPAPPAASPTPKKLGPPFQADTRIAPGDVSRNVWPGSRDTAKSAAAPPQVFHPFEERATRARQLLNLAQEDYQRQQWLACLEHCKTLAMLYPDMPEGLEARQLALRIKGNPDLLERLGRDLTENLAEVYWELAQSKLRQNQTTQAIPYLEKIVQTCPGTRYTPAAQDYLTRMSVSATPPKGYKTALP